MIQPGTRLAHYEIVSALGKGGMGEVWRARDTKLGRDVAIKTLPAEFVDDADRLARFEREARLLASLNHTNIAAIYGLEEHDASRFLVLELVEGDTLGDRIRRGAIPVEESLKLALQIAEALEAAHDKGVIHRDLKPANIKVTDDGKVKVLDFGLAKALGGDESDINLSNSPTLSMAATQQGIIFGTAAYMSPEQARGRAVDRRTDVWAFGAILHEMLTGKPAFPGEDLSDILASVLKTDPDWDGLPADLHPRLVATLRRCLAKDPRRRFRDIGDVKYELEEAALSPTFVGATESDARGPGRRMSALVMASAVLIAFVIGAVGTAMLMRPSLGDETVVDLRIPSGSFGELFELSPDGRSLLFRQPGDNSPQLWMRSLDTGEVRALPNTENPQRAIWSPDGESIAFVNRSGELRRNDLDSGVSRVLATGVDFNGRPGWSSDGTLLFRSGFAGVGRIQESGGTPEEVLLDGIQGQGEVSSLDFFPESRQFLISVRATAGSRRRFAAYLAELGSSETRLLLEADSPPIPAPPDRILFADQGVLFSQQFDGFGLRGEPQPIGAVGVQNRAASASRTGSIVYRSAANDIRRQFEWRDRGGNVLERVGPEFSAFMANPELSPDERRVVFESRSERSTPNLWLLDLTRGGVASQFTFEGISVGEPTWSPGGDRIGFFSARNGSFDLYSMPVEGTGEEELLVIPDISLTIKDWHDETLIVGDFSDLWALTLDGDGTFVPVVESAGTENNGQVSPDGQWLAYDSDRSEGSQVYVQPFGSFSGGAIRVSIDGGAQPRWNANGEELFYLTLDGRLMSVPLEFSDDGARLTPGVPTPLFETRIGDVVGNRTQQYDVSADGERFLINSILESDLPLTLILNWRADE